MLCPNELQDPFFAIAKTHVVYQKKRLLGGAILFYPIPRPIFTAGALKFPSPGGRVDDEAVVADDEGEASWK